jgi:sphingomyelin phosphodiesterase
MNFYLVANVTDPSSQLEWLEAQLADSEAKREGVYITSHISPNLLECSTIWSEVYRALIARYNFTIKGQFYGHTHNDMFVVYTHSLTK